MGNVELMHLAITLLCLIGTVLNIGKHRSCFLFWLTGNVLWMTFDLQNDFWSRAFLDFVHAILALAGWYAWKKQEK